MVYDKFLNWLFMSSMLNVLDLILFENLVVKFVSVVFLFIVIDKEYVIRLIRLC